MSTTMAYASVKHDAAALHRAGLPLALRQWVASLFADRHHPVELSRAEKAQREAENVRKMADGYRKSDPAFASDLYAAANRHEVAYGCDS